LSEHHRPFFTVQTPVITLIMGCTCPRISINSVAIRPKCAIDVERVELGFSWPDHLDFIGMCFRTDPAMLAFKNFRIPVLLPSVVLVSFEDGTWA
jgi:hypothetical protein